MDLAARLLDAHVAFEMRQLQSAEAASLIAEEIDHALAAGSALTLDRVVTREQITAVATKYVATFRLPGAIPEIAGEIARRLRSHPANDITVGELLHRPQVAELITVIAEMSALRGRILRGLAENAALQAGVGQMVRGAAAEAVESGRKVAARIPGVVQGLTLAARITARVAGPVVLEVDQRGRELSELAARLLLEYLGDSAATTLSDDELRAAALEVWDGVSGLPVRDVLAMVSDRELVELLVALYEGWLEMRDSAYIVAMVEAGVDFFFDTYGSFTLDRLLGEFGLDRDDLVEEAMRFGPPVIAVLAETGALEALLRRRLGAFYLSDEAAELLG